MKNVNFITIHPEFVETYFKFGVFAAAQRQDINLQSIDLRKYSRDRHGSVDDRPYGGGDGMVMRPDCLANCLKDKGKESLVIYTSPKGVAFNDREAKRLASLDRPITFICGRFAGVDQRFIDTYVDIEYSIGDFVLAGGELPSLAIAEAILRFKPGVLGNQSSSANDSFSEAYEGRLEYPLYTRPEVFEGRSVPKELLSGDHKLIEKWRQEQSLEETRKKRPDLLHNLEIEDKR